MKNYELTYLIAPDLSEQEIDALQEKVSALIQAEKGILVETGKEVKKQIFTANQKNKQGFLVTLNLSLEGGKLDDLGKKLKAEEKIIRYVILTKQPVKFKMKTRAIKGLESKTLVKEKPKVELEKIEQKLEEILGE